MRVVIAESEPSIATELRDVLSGDGRFDQVEAVADGDAAARAASGADVVVIDLSVEGRGSLGTIGAMSRLSRAPVIIALGSGPEAWKVRAARAEGAHAIIDWPADRDRLLASVSDLLAQRT